MAKVKTARTATPVIEVIEHGGEGDTALNMAISLHGQPASVIALAVARAAGIADIERWSPKLALLIEALKGEEAREEKLRRRQERQEGRFNP